MTKYGRNHKRYQIKIIDMKSIMFPTNIGNAHWKCCDLMNPGKIWDSYKYHKLKSKNNEVPQGKKVIKQNIAPCVLIYDSLNTKINPPIELLQWLDKEVNYICCDKRAELFSTREIYGKKTFPVININGEKCYYYIYCVCIGSICMFG